MSIEHPRQSVKAELARFLRHDAQRTDREAGLVAELIAAVKRIRGFEGIAGTTAIVKGFRMPASHCARGCTEAGVRKASKEETAGEYAPAAVSVYGDLRRGSARLGRSRTELPA